MLFPIRLVDQEALEKWELFDAKTKKDLPTEICEYFIPDFSNWEDDEAFEKAFNKLLRDLEVEEPG